MHNLLGLVLSNGFNFQAQRLGLHHVQRRYHGNLPLQELILLLQLLAHPGLHQLKARGLEPLLWVGRTAPAPSTPRTVSRRRRATPPSTSSRGRSRSLTSRRLGRALRWSGKPRCGRCRRSSTAPCSGSRARRRGRCQAQRSPKWLLGEHRAEDQGRKTLVLGPPWKPEQRTKVLKPWLGLRRDPVASEDPVS